MSPPCPLLRLSAAFGSRGPGQGLRGDWVSLLQRKGKERKDQTLKAFECWLGASWPEGRTAYPSDSACSAHPGPPQPELCEATGPWRGGPSLEGCAAGCGPVSWQRGWAPGCCPCSWPLLFPQCASMTASPRKVSTTWSSICKCRSPGTWALVCSQHWAWAGSLVSLADSPPTPGSLHPPAYLVGLLALHWCMESPRDGIAQLGPFPTTQNRVCWRPRQGKKGGKDPGGMVWPSVFCYLPWCSHHCCTGAHGLA